MRSSCSGPFRFGTSTDERAQKRADGVAVGKAVLRPAWPSPYRDGDARFRKGREQVFVGEVVTDGEDSGRPRCRREDPMCRKSFVDAPQSHFDHLLAFKYFERLIAEGVAEQHPELVRLACPEFGV